MVKKAPKLDKSKKPRVIVPPDVPAAPTDRNVEMFNEWKRGAPIHQLVKDFGPVSRSRVRALLTAAAGGKDKFQALRASGAGGRATPRDATTGQRTRATRSADASTAPRIDDSNVPMTLSCKRSDGWTQAFRGNTSELIFTSPEGISYVRAADTQVADLIHIGVPEGLPPVRLRRYAHSGLPQRAKADAAAKEATKAHQREQRANKKARREKRRTKVEKRIAKTGR